MKKINGKNLFSRLLSIAVCAALFLAALPVMNIAGANYDTRYAYIEFDNKVGNYNYDWLDEDHIYFKNDIGAVKNKDVNGDDWNIKVDKSKRTIYLKDLNAWNLKLNEDRVWITKVVLIGNSTLIGTLNATVVKTAPYNTLEITAEGSIAGSLNIKDIYKGIDLAGGSYNVGRYHCGINLYSEYSQHDEYKRNLIISNGAKININISGQSVTNDKGELKPSILKEVSGIYVRNGDLILKDQAKVNITAESDGESSAWSVNGVSVFYGKVIMGKETQLNIDVSKFKGRVSTPRGILSNYLTVNEIDQLRILTGYYGELYYGREEEIVYDNNKTYKTQYNYTVRNALLSKDGISQAQLFEIKNKNLDKHAKVNLSGAYFLDKIYDTDSSDPADMYTSNEIYREINTEGGNKILYIKPMDYSEQGQSFDSWGVRYSTENGTVRIDDNSGESVYKTLYDTLNDGAWGNDAYYCAPIAKTINEVDIYQKYKYSVQLSHTDGGGIDLTDGDGNKEENSTKAWVGEKPVMLEAIANDGYQFSRWEIYDTKGNKMGETQYGGPTINANLNDQTLTLNYTGQHYEVRAVFELADNEITYRYKTNYTEGDFKTLSKTDRILNDSSKINWTFKAGEKITLPKADDFNVGGYSFAGWYKDRFFTGAPVTETDGTTDRYFAKFVKDANSPYELYVMNKYSNGTLNTTGTKASAGSAVYFTLTPNKGYRLKSGITPSVYYRYTGSNGSSAIKEIDCTEVASGTGVFKFTVPSNFLSNGPVNSRIFIKVEDPFELETYNITYNLNGGTLVTSALPNTYTVLKEESYYEGDTIVDVSKFLTGKSYTTAIPATRPGYVWKGWCRTADCSDEPIKYIPAGGTISGNLQLYACWVRTQFEIETVYSKDTPDDSNNGVITIGDGSDSAKFAYAGDTVKFTAAADSGCMFWQRSLSITYYDGISTYNVDYTYDDATGEYSFTMPALIKFGSSNPTVKIEATFYQTYMLNLPESSAYTCELDKESVKNNTLSGELNNVRDGAVFYMTLKPGKGYYTGKDTKVYVNGTEIPAETGNGHAGQYKLFVTEDMTVTVSGVDPIPYDVNLDGCFDIRDLIKLKKIIAGIYNDPEERANADINKDDAIDAQDIAKLRKALLEL